MPVFFSLLSALGGDQASQAVAIMVPRSSVAEIGAASVPFLGFLAVSFVVSRLIARLSEAPV